MAHRVFGWARRAGMVTVGAASIAAGVALIYCLVRRGVVPGVSTPMLCAVLALITLPGAVWGAWTAERRGRARPVARARIAAHPQPAEGRNGRRSSVKPGIAAEAMDTPAAGVSTSRGPSRTRRLKSPVRGSTTQYSRTPNAS